MAIKGQQIRLRKQRFFFAQAKDADGRNSMSRAQENSTFLFLVSPFLLNVMSFLGYDKCGCKCVEIGTRTVQCIKSIK